MSASCCHHSLQNARVCRHLVALELDRRVLLLCLVDGVLGLLILPEVDDVRGQVQQQHPVPAEARQWGLS